MLSKAAAFLSELHSPTRALQSEDSNKQTWSRTKTEGRMKRENPGGFIRSFKGPIAGETREPKKHPRAHRCAWEASGQDKAGIL